MRVMVTGSGDGLGRAAALALQQAEHEVVVHVRNEARRNAVAELVAEGAQVVVGDLAHLEQVRDVAAQANAFGRMDAVIHNTRSYSDSKLFVTTLSAAIARLWASTYRNAVDPGWVPTRMGGPKAPDDLRLGHVTQVWLATSDDPEARTSGGYWHHQRRADPHHSVHDEHFQDQLLDALATHTGLTLGGTS